MARIDWVKHRLENWALWVESERSGSMGFSTQSPLLKCERVDETRQVRLPIDEIDAALTDRAVSSLKLTHADLHATLKMFYVEGIGVTGIQQRIGKAASTIHARLDSADRLLSAWFGERKEVQEAAKRSFTP